MRFTVFSFCLFFLTGCQFNSNTANLQIVGKLNGKKSYPVPVSYKAPITTSAKKYTNERVKFSFESNLIFNSQFIFLEYVKMGSKQLKGFKNVTADYALESQLTDIYDIGAHPINIKYENVIGRNIFINNEDRSQFKAKIKSIVVIKDQFLKKPYFAAVLELPETVTGNAVWANTSTRINPFPFVNVQDEMISNLALTYFDSLAEFHILQDQILSSNNDFEYESNEVHIFDARPQEKYVLVQHYWMGNCASISYNYSALYHVTPSGWVLDTEGALNEFFIDFIDTNGDFYPEILMGDIGTTSIYEINYKGFSKRNSLGWSSTICPC